MLELAIKVMEEYRKPTKPTLEALLWILCKEGLPLPPVWI